MNLRLDDTIRDEALRAWAQDYTDSKVAERKARKTSSEDLIRAWRSYTEADWAAFRELLELRPRARAKFDQGELDIAVARKVASLGQRYVLGQPYPAAYSFGVEVAALRELLGDSDPRPRETAAFPGL